MLKKMNTILFTISLFLLLNSHSIALPAFPGAEGMGAASVGGRGGTVYVVDQLGDNATAEAAGTTFREACTASGPRYVLFSVSGVIDLESRLIIDDPYITIAGETSPGGIVVSSSQTNINTHDVIVRHMRFRLGQSRITSSNAEQIGDAVEIGSYSTAITDPVQYNIIFDHCSFSWGVDETVSVVCNSSDITFSWCIFGPGLYRSVHSESPHGAGFIAWGKYAQNQRISLHHSLFIFNSFRSPENNYNSFIDGVNNVGYGHETTRTWEISNISGYSATANAIGCYTKTDVSTNYGRTIYIIQYATPTPSPIIYMTGCLDGTRKSQSDPQWSVQEYFHNAEVTTDFRASTPFSTVGWTGEGIAVTPTVMSESYATYIVENTGATKPVRDTYDTSLITMYKNNTGRYTIIDGVDVDTITEVESLAGTFSGVYPEDSDSDGMSDDWELANDLNIGKDDSAGDINSNGYSNIEEYLHCLASGNTIPGKITGLRLL